jgi:hypothetical protein
LLEAEVAKDFLALVVEQARGQGWASDEHFAGTEVCWKQSQLESREPTVYAIKCRRTF